MTDGRSPRIHLFLTIWTLLLIGLVLVEIRRLLPELTVLLVPYLALMASHWIGRLRQRGRNEPVMPRHDKVGSPSDNELDECADSPTSIDRSGCDDCPMPVSLHPIEEPAPPPSRRGRARRRPRAPEAEPSASSWVQVRPGRFVRVEEMSQEHPDDEAGSDSRPDEPHELTPLDEPGAPLEAISIPADADAEVSESQVQAEANHADEDVTEPIAPPAP